jgi:hypothetical protein
MSDLDVIVTGVVGIAGTLLGAWLTSRSQMAGLKVSIQAENERSRRADMGARYAAYLTRVNEMATALNSYPEDGDTESQRAYAAKELRLAMQSLYDAHNEVTLTAPPGVREAVDDTTAAYENEYFKRKADGVRPRRSPRDRRLDKALEAMQADLNPTGVTRPAE